MAKILQDISSGKIFAKIVQQSGKTKETDYGSIGPPAKIADQPALGKVIFSIKYPANKTVFIYTVAQNRVTIWRHLL